MAGCPLNMMLNSKPSEGFSDCTKKLHAAHDLLEVLKGKWKMEVILCLLEFKKRRFREFQKNIPGISSRILSSVLKDLENNQIITRQVVLDIPITVEYKLTDYGQSMQQVIKDLVKLGMEHRSQVMGK
ncbi:MAG TPA: helix-turn-helix domain-containing protein [Cytophagaceae bacterium]|nr:helix-turn-helix domain-containing protein [Cytophagaceae bacterium]